MVPDRYLDCREPATELPARIDADAAVAACCWRLKAIRDAKRDRRWTQLRLGEEDKCAVAFLRGTDAEYSAGVLKGHRVWLHARLDDDILAGATLIPSRWRGCMVPVYKGFKQKPFERADHMADLLDRHHVDAARMLEEALGYSPDACLQRIDSDFADFEELIEALHAPASPKEAMEARRVAFALSALCELARAHRALSHDARPRRWDLSAADISREQARLPVTLTDAQRTAGGEWLADLRAGRPGARLLSGDVGSGKTFVYLPIMVALLQAGARVSVVSPNRILALQIHSALQASYPDAPVAFVASKRTTKGNAPHVARGMIGTQAVFHHHQKHETQPDVLIIDEEQKLGNLQKQSVLGPETHLLEVTATPLPRTLALASFCGMRISRLDSQPVEKEIETELHEPYSLGPLSKSIRRIVADGDQIAIIYASKRSGYGSVAEATARLSEEFPGRVAKLYGQQDKDEANAALLAIESGRAAVVVATTVIEIGVTFQRLRGMVVIGADRYGLSTLHQLRGRLARTGGHGLFAMVPSVPLEELSEKTRDRLETIVEHDDGAEIAARDMLARGMGDLKKFGIQQSGERDALFAGVRLSAGLLERFLRAYPRSPRTPPRPATHHANARRRPPTRSGAATPHR